MASLDFLHRADIMIHQLCQRFLGDFSAHPLPAQIRVRIKSLKWIACGQGL